jgi:hypothetical protein
MQWQTSLSSHLFPFLKILFQIFLVIQSEQSETLSFGDQPLRCFETCFSWNFYTRVCCNLTSVFAQICLAHNACADLFSPQRMRRSKTAGHSFRFGVCSTAPCYFGLQSKSFLLWPRFFLPIRFFFYRKVFFPTKPYFTLTPIFFIFS